MEDILDAKHCKRIQQVVIIYSLVMLLVFLYFLLFQYTKYMLLLFLIASTVTVALNYYFAKFYGIRMEDKTIVFENMWKKNKNYFAKGGIRQYIIDLKNTFFVH